MPAHDELFKLLISELPYEFIQLFYPNIANQIERKSMLPLDKELLAGLHHKGRRHADLVFRAKLMGEESSFAIHVEPQASFAEGFPLRMFFYFARVKEKYSLPVYPIALLSYEVPTELQPSGLEESILGESILRFHYKTIQLNRLDWKAYARCRNPVAAALMARMFIAKHERPEVRFSCISLLASFKRLHADTKAIIAKFIDAYLVLKPDEIQEYEEMVEQAGKKKREEIMDLTNSWQLQGRQEGRQEGALSLVLRQLHKRLGKIEANLVSKIELLAVKQLESLSEALLDFGSIEELSEWVSKAPLRET